MARGDRQKARERKETNFRRVRERKGKRKCEKFTNGLDVRRKEYEKVRMGERWKG